MSSNLTNPEQVCPTCKSFDPGFRNRTDGSPLYGPLCTDSWHGKVAAKPQLHMSGDGNGNWRECECEIGDNHLRDTSPVEAAKPDDLHELFYDNVADARAALEAKYAAPAPVDQPDELDTIDTLTRDACSVGYCGPKSVYRKRLNAYIARRVLEELEALRPLVHPHDGNDMVTDILNERIAVIKKESQQ